jgi:hypothetical protein
MRGKRSRRGPGSGGEVAEEQDPQAEIDPETPKKDSGVETGESVAVGEDPAEAVEAQTALSDDLDALSKELEKSLSSESTAAPVAAAPEINATPEEILGVVMKTEAPSSPESPPQPTEAKEAPTSNPQDGHAAMATEVLRATTDQANKPEDADEETDSKVRFSDDVTISAKKKRRLFGR